MAEIEYSRESYNRCNCGGCPVQRRSACVQELERALGPLKDGIQRDGVMPEPEAMPGVYCSSAVGRSRCEDLDGGKACLCPACTLAITEGLEGSYYCLGGAGEGE